MPGSGGTGITESRVRRDALYDCQGVVMFALRVL